MTRRAAASPSATPPRGRLALPADDVAALLTTTLPTPADNHDAPLEIGSQPWWDAVEQVGAPRQIAEPDETYITFFVFREADPITAVYVDVQPFTDRTDLSTGLMDQVPGTDVWVAAFLCGPEWISAYTFIPLDAVPQAPGPRDDPATRAWWISVLAGAQPDPLNPAPPFTAMRGDARSVARSPGAPVAPALPPGARRGHVERFVWHRPAPDGNSHEAYDAWVYTSAGLTDAAEHGDGCSHTGATHSDVLLHGGQHGGVQHDDLPRSSDVPLLLLLDGQVWAGSLDVTAVFDSLVADGEVPPFAAVLLSSVDPERRSRDLPGSPGFLDDVADELLPLVALDLASLGVALTDDPARTVVCGQSYGGLASFQAARLRPDRFGLVLAQSASVWWPRLESSEGREIADWLRTAPERSTRCVVQYGAHEGSLTDANREVVALLRQRREHVEAREVDGGHDWAWWHACLADGLRTLLGRLPG